MALCFLLGSGAGIRARRRAHWRSLLALYALIYFAAGGDAGGLSELEEFGEDIHCCSKTKEEEVAEEDAQRDTVLLNLEGRNARRLGDLPKETQRQVRRVLRASAANT